MLDEIARDCRRWTADLPVEIALVVPTRRARPMPSLAVERGTDDAVAMPVDRILRVALACGGDAVVIAHNHPSGHRPSSSDFALTRRFVAAGEVIGLPLLAHLVVTADGWYNCVDLEPALKRWQDRVA